MQELEKGFGDAHKDVLLTSRQKQLSLPNSDCVNSLKFLMGC